MLPVLALRHIPCEGPGLIETVARQRGVEVVVRDLPGDIPIWPDPIHHSGVLVLGGPISVYDPNPQLYWIRDEIRLLRRCRDEGIPILGICLGAQLLAAVFEADVYPGGSKEIGWGPVEFTSEARRDLLFRDLPDTLTVFHWHGDTFDLPDRARLLASSPLFPNQAFRVEDRYYGLQYHLEVTADMADAWTQEYAAELEATGGPTVGETFADSAARAVELQPHAETVFGRWLDRLAEWS